MQPNEFADLLASFAQRPVPPVSGRHVYVWHGELPALDTAIPAGLAVQLDLYDLAADLSKHPYALDEARRLLQTAIQTWLRTHAPAPGKRQVIAVTGCTLLERYRVPLDAFFQVAGDSRMTILCVPPSETSFAPRRPLPGYVIVQPAAALVYLAAIVGEQATIGAAIP